MAAYDAIVVGAGVQMLLEILCVLLKGRRTVSFPDSSFVQGSTVFAAREPARCAALPAAAMMTPKPFSAALPANTRASTGVRCAE